MPVVGAGGYPCLLQKNQVRTSICTVILISGVATIEATKANALVKISFVIRYAV